MSVSSCSVTGDPLTCGEKSTSMAELSAGEARKMLQWTGLIIEEDMSYSMAVWLNSDLAGNYPRCLKVTLFGAQAVSTSQY